MLGNIPKGFLKGKKLSSKIKYINGPREIKIILFNIFLQFKQLKWALHNDYSRHTNNKLKGVGLMGRSHKAIMLHTVTDKCVIYKMLYLLK